MKSLMIDCPKEVKIKDIVKTEYEYGRLYNLNLDTVSAKSMTKCFYILKNGNELLVDRDVIARRALRMYFSYLDSMSSDSLKDERNELIKVAKGNN